MFESADSEVIRTAKAAGLDEDAAAVAECLSRPDCGEEGVTTRELMMTGIWKSRAMVTRYMRSRQNRIETPADKVSASESERGAEDPQVDAGEEDHPAEDDPEDQA